MQQTTAPYDKGSSGFDLVLPYFTLSFRSLILFP